MLRKSVTSNLDMAQKSSGEKIRTFREMRTATKKLRDHDFSNSSFAKRAEVIEKARKNGFS